MAGLSGAAWKTLAYLARRTIGFRKESDNVSLGQICRGIVTRDGGRLDCGTGLSRPAAVRAVSELEGEGLIIITHGRDGDINGYALNLDGLLSKKLTSNKMQLGVVKKLNQGVVKKVNPQESVLQDSVLQDSALKTDYDYQPTNRSNGDSSPGLTKCAVNKQFQYTSSEHTQMKALIDSYGKRKTMREMMGEEVPERIVEMCLDAACGEPLTDIANLLQHRCSRGYDVGRKNGPRGWYWFPTVIGNTVGQWQAQKQPVLAPRSLPNRPPIPDPEFDSALQDICTPSNFQS